MTSSSGGSPRRARSCEAADTGDMSSNSLTAAGSSSVSMAGSITSIPTAPRRIPGCLTIRSGRTRLSGSACTPRPPRLHRKDAAFRERGHRAGSAPLGARRPPGAPPDLANSRWRSPGRIGTPPKASAMYRAAVYSPAVLRLRDQSREGWGPLRRGRKRRLLNSTLRGVPWAR